MTRVEKYAEYRKEIENSFEEVSTKEKTSDLIKEKIRNSETSNNLSYDDVMSAYNIYDSSEVEVEHKVHQLEKKRVAFIAIMVVIIAALIVALVLVGLLTFGGK